MGADSIITIMMRLFSFLISNIFAFSNFPLRRRSAEERNCKSSDDCLERTTCDFSQFLVYDYEKRDEFNLTYFGNCVSCDRYLAEEDCLTDDIFAIAKGKSECIQRCLTDSTKIKPIAKFWRPDTSTGKAYKGRLV